MPRPRSIAKPALLAMLLFAMATVAVGQQGGNVRAKRFVFSSDTLRLDSLSMAPGSLVLLDASGMVGSDRYSVDPFRGLLIRTDPTLTDTLTARWR
jgi:hypothetical protein